MKELIGRKVEKVLIEAGENRIFFVTDKGNVGYSTYSDCCSETWFSDVLSPENLLGKTVISIDDMELPQDSDGRSRQESDDFMGIKITTSSGYTDILYRNSSNGYYGGNLCDADFPADISKDAKEIIQDWSA